MCEVTNCDFSLDLDICEKRPLIVDFEGKYAMLIGCSEGGGEDGAVEGLGDGLKVEAMERGEHAEFELKGIIREDGKRVQPVKRVLGQFNIKCLYRVCQ